MALKKRRYGGSAPRQHGRLRRLFPAAALAGTLMAAAAAHAVDLPLRSIFTAPCQPPLLWRLEALGNGLLVIRYRYHDYYREKGPATGQDYRLSEAEATWLGRSGRFVYGARTGAHSLVLRNDNVYSRSDRMAGGRSQAGGEAVLGCDRRGGRPAGLEYAALATVGWNEGMSASFEGEAGLAGRIALRASAGTHRTVLRIEEEINGSSFPFPFSYRTERYGGGLSVAAGRIRLDLGTGWEAEAGTGPRERGLENAVYHEMISLRGMLAVGIERSRGGIFSKDGRVSALPGLCVDVAHDRGQGSIAMRYNDVRYLHLDRLRTLDSSVRFTVVPVRCGWIFAGWERLRVKHEGDSFAAVWPFTIWDIFVSKRYRLGRVDAHLDTWYLGAGAAVEKGPVGVAVEARFEWWRDAGALAWYEREEVAFPFFFRYISHGEILAISTPYAVQIDPAVTLELRRGVDLILAGRIALPFGEEGADREPPPQQAPPPAVAEGDGVRRHGGLFGAAALRWAW